MKMYIDYRIKKIKEHNQRVMETLRIKTENLRRPAEGMEWLSVLTVRLRFPGGVLSTTEQNYVEIVECKVFHLKVL